MRSKLMRAATWTWLVMFAPAKREPDTDLTLKQRAANVTAWLWMLLIASPAFAGPLDGTIGYLDQNVLPIFGDLAVVGVAAYGLAHRADMSRLAIVCASIWTITNHNIVAGAIRGG